MKGPIIFEIGTDVSEKPATNVCFVMSQNTAIVLYKNSLEFTYLKFVAVDLI